MVMLSSHAPFPCIRVANKGRSDKFWRLMNGERNYMENGED